MFDITYDSGLGGFGTVSKQVGTDISVGVGYIVSVCKDVYVAVGRPEEQEAV